MEICKSGRVMQKTLKGKEYYFLRLNLIETDNTGTNKYHVKDIHTELSVGKRNFQKAVALLEEMIEKYNSNSESYYFQDYCRKWLESKKNTVDVITYEGYAYRLSKIENFFSDKNILLEDLSAKDIHKFYQYLLTVEHGKGKRFAVGYSNRTIKDIAILLRAILEEAVELEDIKTNPASKVKIPKKIDNIKSKSYIASDEIEIFFEAIKGHRLEVPLMFCLYYGLRREEVLGLKWNSIHDDGKLYIEHTVAQMKTLVRKDRVKTDASYRCYPIPQPLLEKLKQIKFQKEINQKIYGEEYFQSDYIFTWEDGHLYTPDYLTKSFKKIVRRNPNLDDSLTLHSLRASCVSILIHEGIDIKDVQEWVGHKDIQTTLNIYARINEKEKQKVNQKMLECVFKDV